MKPIKIQSERLVKYSVTPYNFVSFPNNAVTRYKNMKDLPSHNSYKDKNGNMLLNGYIDYTLEAMTPIIVSSGSGRKHDNKKATDAYFFVNQDGTYAIPGSTMRGMVRTNCEILSYSNIVGEDNEDSYENSEIENTRFLFRDVAVNGSLAKKYKDVLGTNQNLRIAKNVKAGYIINRDNKYYIKPSLEFKEGIPYFRIDELSLRKLLKNRDIKGIKFMYNEKLLEHEDELKRLKKGYAKNKNNKDEEKRLRNEINSLLYNYSNVQKKDRNIDKRDLYIPYQVEVSFDYDKESGRIVKIDKKNIFSHNGYLLSGGFILGKLSHYIVSEADENAEPIKISKDDIEAYVDDMIRTKKMKKNGEISNNKNFFGLSADGQQKPVFYINTNRLHFGFTPFLRIDYSKRVLDGVPESYKNVEGISYTDGIFGFTKKVKKDNKNVNYDYKSRVSFEDAEVIGNAILDNDSEIALVLAEPKPTSYNLYLKQDLDSDKNTLKIYEDEFKIRGYKEYWLKDYIEYPELKSNKNEGVKTIVHPLKEGTKFRGRIYFSNLYKDELGLLCWAIRLNDNCYQNIGLAKPYGFGRIKVEDIKLYIENLDKKYDSFTFDYYDHGSIDEYIDFYKSEFSKRYLNGKDIDGEANIKEFMTIKSKVVRYNDSNFYRYMRLDEFKDHKVLPSIRECGSVYTENNRNHTGKYIDSHKKESHHKKDNNNYGNTAIADAFKHAQKFRKKR